MLAADSSRFVRALFDYGWICPRIANSSSVIQSWHVFLGYQITNFFAFFFNCYGRILPVIGQLAFWISLLSFFIILVAVPSKAPTHQDARFVFANFINNTGWKENGIGKARSKITVNSPS